MGHDTLAELRPLAGRWPLKVLILGTMTPKQRAEVLQEFRAGCGRDMYHPQRTMAFELPIVSTGIIVVIDEVVDLSSDDQQTLLQWLEQHRDAIVISFATKPIFPLVAEDKFLDRLYYRLNVLTLHVSVSSAWPPGDRYTRSGTTSEFIRRTR